MGSRGRASCSESPAKARSAFLIVESRQEVQLPDKGILGQHALFDPAMIEVPEPAPPPPPEEG